VNSDHHPIEVWIKEREQEGKERGKERESRNGRDIWNEEGCKEFEVRMERIISEERGEKGNGEEDERGDRRKRIMRNGGKKRRMMG